MRTVSSSSLVSEDLSPSSGVVTFANGQSGSIVIKVMALPYGGITKGCILLYLLVLIIS